MDEPEVLLKLHRKYSKDEEVQWLIQAERQKYIDQGVLIGQQKSYIHELEDARDELQRKLNSLDAESKKEIKALNAKLVSLQSKQDTLSKKYNDLLNSGSSAKIIADNRKLNKKISELKSTISTLVSKQNPQKLIIND